MTDRTMKPVDVVIVGFGWGGAIMAKELTEEGLQVLALKRGVYRDIYPDGAYPSTLDELTYLQRFKLFQDMSASTFTFRYDVKGVALPYRQIGAFKPGTGVLQTADPTSAIHIVLSGFSMPATRTSPSRMTMGPYALVLDNQQVADVVTFVQTAWGNQGASATAEQVAKVRKSSKPVDPQGWTAKTP